MKNDNSHTKKNCGAAYYASVSVCSLLVLVSIFIYWYIPVSDIANSPEHSSKVGLALLAISPVFAVLSFAGYLVGGLLDKALVKNAVVQRVIFIVSSVLLFVISCISVALMISQLSLGFVAPFTGMVWSKLGVLAVVAAVLFYVGNGYIVFTAKK